MATFGDMTGKAKEALAEEYRKEQEAKAHSMSLATADLEAQAVDEPIELKTNEEIEAERAALAAIEAEEDGLIEVDSAEPKKTFKVNTDLDEVTIGHGNNYSFKRGQTYTAPFSVYWHLECLNAIWH